MKITAIILLCFLSIHGEEKRVVLITGASKGVGLATLEYLDQRGFIVYGTTRQASFANEKMLQVDLCDENSIERAVGKILAKEGRIDVLINNAGYALVGPVESFTQDELKEQMEINFYAPIRMIQAVLPAMRHQKSGHIINISSVNAYSTPPFGGLYAASKAALESLSESLSIEVKPLYIFVSLVEPGLIQTGFSLPMGTKEIPNNPYKEVMEKIQAEIEERVAAPEKLTPSQSAVEIAEFLFSIIQDPHPKLRYQTSVDAQEEVSKKLRDLTGEIYLDTYRN